ncbi:EAL domain-containing protein [Marinobacter sp. 1Y8]
MLNRTTVNPHQDRKYAWWHTMFSGARRAPQQCIVFILLTLIALPALATQPISATSLQQSLTPQTDIYIESQPLALNDVMQLTESDWQTAPDDINKGYDNRVHWFRIELNNSSGQDLDRLLEIAYPLLDFIEFYEVRNNQLIRKIITGDELPFSARPIANTSFVFPLELDAASTTTVYLRISTQGTLLVPLALWQDTAFWAASSQQMVWHSMFYGILLVMATFNFFLFLSIRERAYFYYVVVVFSTLMLMMSLHGFSFQYLYPEWPRINDRLLLFIVPFSQLSLCLFASEFLMLKKRHTYWHRMFLVLAGFAGVMALASLFLPYAISTRASVALAIPISLANLAAGLTLLLQGEKNARFFSIAWISLLLGVLATVLHQFGLLPSLFIIENGIPLGASIQALLFSFALADRYNRSKEAYFRVKENQLAALQRQQETEAALYRASSHHELTGLPNRVLFESIIKSGQQPEDEPKLSALFLVHLLHFDDVNKTLGHEYADQLLTQCALRLNTLVSQCPGVVILEQTPNLSAIAHVEGVSFTFMLTGSTRKDIIDATQPLTDGLSNPIEFLGLILEQQFVVGCSFAEANDFAPSTLLREAFIAFDQHHHLNGQIAIYHPEMNPYSPRRLMLMTDLREALRTDNLALHFQPQIHLQSRRVAGFEALIRWHHPDHGLVPPDEFIPMAEQTGLIKPVTRWVIMQALQFCKALDQLDCDATVSVNISAINLREPDFCEEVCELLSTHHVAAQRLVLEVTESAAMADPTHSLAVLNALKNAHIRLSIDDFGTGHSSLSYIRKLPVNEIKIDRSFVTDMSHNQGDETIVRTTLNMCHDLGYEVVAEGVENAETQTLLSEMGCDVIQGYHIARPMAADAALAWLAATEWARHHTPE